MKISIQKIVGKRLYCSIPKTKKNKKIINTKTEINQSIKRNTKIEEESRLIDLKRNLIFLIPLNHFFY